MSQSTDSVPLPNVTQDTTDEINHRQPLDVVVPPNRSGGVIAPTKKTAGGTQKQYNRHNGLKMSFNACSDGIQSRRRCQGDSRIDVDMTADVVRDLDPNLSPEEVNAVLNDYKHALRILSAKTDSRNDTNLTLEFMIGLVNGWRPKLK